MSVVQVEDQIEAAGARIVWVLEEAPAGPGTAEECVSFMTLIGSERGLCVGDDDTMPFPDEFDDSPFSRGRGFDIVVARETMVIEETTNHGTTGGNDNLSGEDVLALVEDVIGRL